MVSIEILACNLGRFWQGEGKWGEGLFIEYLNGSKKGEATADFTLSHLMLMLIRAQLT
jgi:hypothetical protein